MNVGNSSTILVNAPVVALLAAVLDIVALIADGWACCGINIINSSNSNLTCSLMRSVKDQLQ